MEMRPAKAGHRPALQVCQMSFELIPFPNATELARTVAARWLDELAKRGANQNRYAVALSGGRVARDFFQAVAQQSVARRVSFKDVHFFWGDERCVPPTDPESNYAAARDLLFEPLAMPPAQIHRLRGEAEETAALRQARDEIQAVCELDANGQPVLDLIFLGMGEDGHVASLFPGEPAEVIANPAIYRAVTAVKPPPRRITLGYAAIAAARQVWVLASGQGKEQALRISLSPAGNTPLSRVLKSRSATAIFTDIALS
jgi:6-phosphogluconolactonase